MGFFDDSTIGLIFKISADSKLAQEALETLKGHTEAVTGAMQGKFGALANSIQSTLGSVLSPTGLLAGGAGALAGSFLELANKAAESGDKIFEAGEKTGLTAANLSGLRAVTQQVGENFDSLTLALSRAGRNLQAAIDQPGLQSSKVLAQLMGGAQNLAELGLKPMDERLHVVLQRIFALNDVGERNYALNTLLGRGWQDNVETLKMLAEQGYGPAIEKAKEFHEFYDDAAAAQAHEFDVQMNTLKSDLRGLALVVGREAVPALHDLMAAFIDMQSDMRDSATASEKWGEDLRAYMGGAVDFVHELITGKVSTWATQFISAGAIFRRETQAATNAEVAALPGHERYREALDKVKKATELAAKAHIPYTQALYDLAHGITPVIAAQQKDAESEDAGTAATKRHTSARHAHSAALHAQTQAVTAYTAAVKALGLEELPLVQADRELLASMLALDPAVQKFTAGAQSQIAALPVWDERSRKLALDLISLVPDFANVGTAATKMSQEVIAALTAVDSKGAQWSEDSERQLGTLGSATLKYASTVTEAIDRELLAYGVSQKALQGIYKALLGDLASFLSQVAQKQAQRQIAEALGDLADFNYVGAAEHFAAAAAWEVLGAAVSAGAGSLTGQTAAAARVAGPAAASQPHGPTSPLAPGYSAAVAAANAGQPAPVTINVEASGMFLATQADVSKVVCEAVTRGVEQHGMRVVSSHTRRPGPAGR